MLITIALVLLVVLMFMRRLMPTIAAAVTVPLSICGTLAGMWFMGYLLDNFSLMALTISVGFVVDDAIVMIENIVRHRERGVDPMRAALIGSRQIGFTVMSISISLVAVFIPLIFMGGIMGRLFHEFAMTLTMAIAVSAVVSLTLTPMICGRYMRARHRGSRRTAGSPRGSTARWSAASPPSQRFYARDARLGAGAPRVHAAGDARHHRADGAALHRGAEGLPAAAGHRNPDRLHPRLARRVVPGDGGPPARGGRCGAAPTRRWPASAPTVGVSNGWSSINRGSLTVSLKPLSERGISSEAVIARLRGPLEKVGGVQTTLFSAQDLRGGGRQGGAQYQYAVVAQDVNVLRRWALALEDKLRTTPGIVDVTSDQDRAGPQVERGDRPRRRRAARRQHRPRSTTR